MLKDRIIKTVVPFVVGWLISLLALKGIVLPPDMLEGLTNGLTLVIGTVYYVLAVLLAKKWPKFELLLGSMKKPVYKEIK